MSASVLEEGEDDEDGAFDDVQESACESAVSAVSSGGVALSHAEFGTVGAVFDTAAAKAAATTTNLGSESNFKNGTSNMGSESKTETSDLGSDMGSQKSNNSQPQGPGSNENDPDKLEEGSQVNLSGTPLSVSSSGVSENLEEQLNSAELGSLNTESNIIDIMPGPGSVESDSNTSNTITSNTVPNSNTVPINSGITVTNPLLNSETQSTTQSVTVPKLVNLEAATDESQQSSDDPQPSRFGSQSSDDPQPSLFGSPPLIVACLLATIMIITSVFVMVVLTYSGVCKTKSPFKPAESTSGPGEGASDTMGTTTTTTTTSSTRLKNNDRGKKRRKSKGTDEDLSDHEAAVPEIISVDDDEPESDDLLLTKFSKPFSNGGKAVGGTPVKPVGGTPAQQTTNPTLAAPKSDSKKRKDVSKISEEEKPTVEEVSAPPTVQEVSDSPPKRNNSESIIEAETPLMSAKPSEDTIQVNRPVNASLPLPIFDDGPDDLTIVSHNAKLMTGLDPVKHKWVYRVGRSKYDNNTTGINWVLGGVDPDIEPPTFYFTDLSQERLRRTGTPLTTATQLGEEIQREMNTNRDRDRDSIYSNIIPQDVLVPAVEYAWMPGPMTWDMRVKGEANYLRLHIGVSWSGEEYMIKLGSSDSESRKSMEIKDTKAKTPQQIKDFLLKMLSTNEELVSVPNQNLLKPWLEKIIFGAEKGNDSNSIDFISKAFQPLFSVNELNELKQQSNGEKKFSV